MPDGGRLPAAAGGDPCRMPQGKKVQQPVTDDSIQVPQLSHYEFSWVAGEPGDVHYDIRRRTLMFGTTPVGS